MGEFEGQPPQDLLSTTDSEISNAEHVIPMGNTNVQPEVALEDWFSLQEASALLGVATSTLRRWGDAGRVPMKRTLGGHRRFPRQAITRLAETLAREAPLAPAQPAAHGLGDR